MSQTERAYSLQAALQAGMGSLRTVLDLEDSSSVVLASMLPGLGLEGSSVDLGFRLEHSVLKDIPPDSKPTDFDL